MPHVLPCSARFWTTLSGVVELLLAVGVVWPRTRRVAATLTAVFFVLVFPANVQMAGPVTCCARWRREWDLNPR